MLTVSTHYLLKALFAKLNFCVCVCVCVCVCKRFVTVCVCKRFVTPQILGVSKFCVLGHPDHDPSARF